LDSAFVEDARRSAKLGFVAGITTNPTLVAETGRKPLDLIAELCDVHPGTIFYQPGSDTTEEREAEARQMIAVRPGRIAVKLPSTTSDFSLAMRLTEEGMVVGMTAVFSPAQVYLAVVAGVSFVLPYVNRSTRALGDGLALVRSMRSVINTSGSTTEILAASIKSSTEAIDTLLAGAHSLTVPLKVIEQLGRHELSDQAIAGFRQSVLNASYV
jgi:transaldolase